MRPDELIVRCFAEAKGDHWQAFSVDLNLAAQGDSYDDVRRRLHEQIEDYLYDALEGEDKAYSDQLLSRKAPFSIQAKYYYIKCLLGMNHARNGFQKLFNETMPMRLAH